MRIVSCCLLAFLLVRVCQNAAGQQDSSARSTEVYTEIGTLLTSGRAVPFWQRANQYGTVPLTGSLGTLRLGIASDYRPLPARRVDWGFGLDLVGNTSPSGQQLIIPQAYVKARWRQLELYVGRRRTILGLVDTLLTSGSYSMSGNALPLPTIQIGTRGYAPIGFTKGLLSVNATFGHAWFESANRLVSHTFLHQATLYVRIGKPTWMARFYVGVNHQAVWGGYSPYLPAGLSVDGKLPTSLESYYYVVTAKSDSDLSVDGHVSSFDETNRIGNHLGSLDIGAEVDLGNTTILLYRQNPYDTGAIVYLTTIADGLNGLSIRRRQPGSGFISVDRGLFEFLYTGNQGGNQFVIDDPQLRGKVNYFNNSQYQDGWTTRAHTIGTPFLTPEGDIRPWLPYGPIINNRVSVLHFGLSGRMGREISWLLKLSNSKNAGTYDAPFATVLNQFSGLVQVSAPLHLPLLGRVRLNATGAIDRGTFLPNSSGFYLGLRTK
ncbi:capsule assembly Wzi family protein [Spirosoma koreense]